MFVSPLLQVFHRLKILFHHFHLKRFACCQQLFRFSRLRPSPQQLAPGGMGGFQSFLQETSVYRLMPFGPPSTIIKVKFGVVRIDRANGSVPH